MYFAKSFKSIIKNKLPSLVFAGRETLKIIITNSILYIQTSNSVHAFTYQILFYTFKHQILSHIFNHRSRNYHSTLTYSIPSNAPYINLLPICM